MAFVIQRFYCSYVDMLHFILMEKNVRAILKGVKGKVYSQHSVYQIEYVTNIIPFVFNNL